ncbi:glucose-1-phosphate thymidylyltransferase [Murinocardiopsis flavida]|uniref:Glucose-1-phosphate thymidylyltransferase n=1 Tax=Murinocardiopsis flavida TaxID=645275 RepID=A0A2P8DTJ5_9ACTN|nr:glucose-1-phosphate thymidylyltransferase RfbA [Murinocardiopsis flavida]PSL00531.1 glucose-1-phosphate thymidylyltransferase [Murinocardiopsis flavida]
MKGIILAGGKGTRLAPVTFAVSKQLLPVSDKPLIYYPLSVLMLAEIKDILIISMSQDIPHIRRLLGDGSHLGLRITYAEQDEANGIAEAFIIGAEHIGNDSVALVLGDNVFHGHSFQKILHESVDDIEGCVLFSYPVRDPERYGIGEVDDSGNLVKIVEKPVDPVTNRAIVGLYLYDNAVVDIAKNLRPSERGELEITDINQVYIERGQARLVDFGRGFAWFDAGTPDALFEASQYIQVIERRQGVRVACLEEIALRRGFISLEDCLRNSEPMRGSAYGQYVLSLGEGSPM